MGRSSFATPSVVRDIKPLVSQRSIGGLKRTHTLADKSKPMPVLWTVKEGHSVISDLKLLSCVILGNKVVIIIIITLSIIIIIIIIIVRFSPVLLGLVCNCHVSATSRSLETQHFPQYVSCSKDGRQLCTSNDVRNV